MWADLFSRENLPIDVIISPELEVARAIGRRLKVPGATDVIPFAGDRVYLVSLKADASCPPVVNTPLSQLTELFPDLTLRIVSIIRGDRMIVPTPARPDHRRRSDLFRWPIVSTCRGRWRSSASKSARHAGSSWWGGGNIGLFLVSQLEKLQPRLNIKLIEADRHRAERIADQLTHSLVLSGSGLDPDLLGDANTGGAETIVTVTNDDESNILSALLAKRMGCKRAMALVNNPTYPPLISSLGVDVVINPRAVTVSRILQHVRRGRIHAVYSLQDGGGEIIEADALETSPLVGRPLRGNRPAARRYHWRGGPRGQGDCPRWRHGDQGSGPDRALCAGRQHPQSREAVLRPPRILLIHPRLNRPDPEPRPRMTMTAPVTGIDNAEAFARLGRPDAVLFDWDHTLVDCLGGDFSPPITMS